MAVLLLFAGCSASASQATSAPQATAAAAPASSPASTAKELVLTLDELKKYNGQNGMPAYIAVDGVIYDVTNVPQWQNGTHHGFNAGNDLTDAIKSSSPHGVSKLQGVPVVGKLAK